MVTKVNLGDIAAEVALKAIKNIHLSCVTHLMGKFESQRL